MRKIRMVCGILSIMLIIIGIIGGLREMGIYSAPFDQFQYVIGSVIGMLAYVAGVWVLYGIGAGVRVIVLRQRNHRPV